MMTLPELRKHFKWLSDLEGYTKEERAFPHAVPHRGVIFTLFDLTARLTKAKSV